VVTLLTLAIGIGGNAAIFGAVNAVLLRPMGFPAPEQLVQVFKTSVKQPDRAGGTTSPPDFSTGGATRPRSPNWRPSQKTPISSRASAMPSNCLALRSQAVSSTYWAHPRCSAERSRPRRPGRWP